MLVGVRHDLMAQPFAPVDASARHYLALGRKVIAAAGGTSRWADPFAEAVAAAGRKVNAETQNKVMRRDIGETALFQQVFAAAPEPGEPRLRLRADDGSDTYENMHRRAMALAEGLFAAVRNPIAHEADSDLSEQGALEELAAFSVLARWVDRATAIQAHP